MIHRTFLRASYCTAALLSMLPSAHTTQVTAAERLRIEVREPAGIRRFGYPVALVLPIAPTAPKSTVCALHDGERLVPAQLRREETDEGGGRWWLDFNLNLMPHESRTLTLEYGERLSTNSEPLSGLTFAKSPEAFQITNGDHIAWTVGRQATPLVKQVRVPAYQHLRAGGVTLAWHDRDGNRHEMGGDDQAVRPRLVRSGPLVVAVRKEIAMSGAAQGAKAVVDLTFPASKSWVQVDWGIEHATSAVASTSAEIDLNLDPPSVDKPTLVDFGASTLVYLALEQGQSGVLRSVSAVSDIERERSRSWEVLRGARGKLEPFVSSPMTDDERLPAEGWAHVMDRTRCLAVALDRFGHEGDDSIVVTAEGSVTLTRRFLDGAAAGPDATRRMRFWLHFVGFPPHQTAATSPQSMLAPTVVRVTADSSPATESK
jgi:hypothetical protein